MSTVKNQHYVPQFYLRYFANSNSRIHVFDKLQQKTFQANVANIANAKYFYDFSPQMRYRIQNFIATQQQVGKIAEEDIDRLNSFFASRQVVEKQLSRWEDKFARTLNKILASLEKRRRFKTKLSAELAKFAALQIWRTDEQRQLMIELEQKLETALKSEIRSSDDTESFEMLRSIYFQNSPADRHRLHLLDTKMLNETARVLANHIWIIGVNDSNIPFYTSDNPVTKRAHEKGSFAGIASPGVELSFPLSPKYILKMYERSYFGLLEEKDGKLMNLKEENVIYNNSQQVYSSHRQIYSATNNFSLVEQMLSEQPELSKPMERLILGKPLL